MGIQVRRSAYQESQSYEQHIPECTNLKRGWCKRCTCDSCKNGLITRQENGKLFSRECSCMGTAYSRHLLEVCGLDKLAERCTFDTYIPNEDWKRVVKEKAMEYAAGWRNNSFFISGQSGSGKTHICTAICNVAVKEGAKIRYFRWVEDGTQMKGMVNEAEEYKREMDDLAGCDLLYIDDLFKTGCSSADLRLAYELINSRYNLRKPLIISTERSLQYIGGLNGKDGEAISGRIFEMCGKGRFCIGLYGAEKNLRFETVEPKFSAK